MTSKTNKQALPATNTLAEAVAESAEQIWQAGLGAFAKAQQDGGALFDALAREGQELHKLTQGFAGARVPGVGERIGRLAENVGRQASGSWDKIEAIFEDRVARSLRRMGVPTHAELEALRAEVEALKAAIEVAAVASMAAPVETPPAKRTPRQASKRAAKPAAARQ